MSETFIGSIVAGLLTLMVFSYLIGANPLWRIAQSLLVGVSVGYVTLVLLTQVIAPQAGKVIAPAAGVSTDQQLLAAVPLALGLPSLNARRAAAMRDGAAVYDQLAPGDEVPGGVDAFAAKHPAIVVRRGASG